MPRGDGTGPFGRGPQTGRGAWLCADPDQGPGFGRRGGAGFGPGRGWGQCRGMMPGAGQGALRRGPAFTSRTDALQDRIARLEEELRALNAQLKDTNN